jgi:hypothetical protein
MRKYEQTEFNWSGQSANVTPQLPAAEPENTLTQATLPGMTEETDCNGGARTAPRMHRRSPAVLPVPKPLPSAIGRGHFGEDEHGPIRPTPGEVRAISENHSERLIDLLDGLDEVERSLRNSQCGDRARLHHEKDRLRTAYQAAIAMYVEDFGEGASKRLEAWALHQHKRRQTSPSG